MILILNNENEQLILNTSEMYKAKSELEVKLSILSNECEKKFKSDQEEYFKLHYEINSIVSKISEKNLIIENLRKEVNHYLIGCKSLFATDNFIINPTKTNVDLNTEIINFTEVIKSFNKHLDVDIRTNKKLELEIKQYEKELENLKKLYKSNHEIKEKIEKSHRSLNSSISYDDIILTEDKKSMNEIKIKKLEEEIDCANVYFPDKFQLRKNSVDITHERRMVAPPKLDLDKIKGKYSSEPAKLSKVNPNPNTSIKIVKPFFVSNYTKIIDINSDNNQNVSSNTNELIDKTRNEIKYSNDTIVDLKEKYSKYMNYYVEAKTKTVKLKENIKIADNKIESLKLQIKQFIEYENFGYLKYGEGHFSADEDENSVESKWSNLS